MPYKTVPDKNFMWGQVKHLPVPDEDLSGRTVAVTGSNSGIGLGVALQLAAMKPTKLILAVRRLDAGEEAAKEVRQKAPAGTEVVVWQLDMSSFKSVRAFAARADKELERLDIFVANAGLVAGTRSLTEDGLETMLQVNAVATALLSDLLIPLLKRTAALPSLPTAPAFRPHLTLVTSWVPFSIGDLDGLKNNNILAAEQAIEGDGFSWMSSAYARTKTVIMLAVPIIAERAGPTVQVTSVDPGWVATSVMKTMPGLGGAIIRFITPYLARNMAEGAAPVTWAAVTDIKEPGVFSASCKVTDPSELICADRPDFKWGRSLWAEMEQYWSSK